MKWHSAHYRDALEALKSSEHNGLTEDEALTRLDTFGPNKLEEKKKHSVIFKFFAQFNDMMIIILLAAAAASLVVSFVKGERDLIDPVIILAIVTMNAILGLVQEYKAEKSLDALKKMSAPVAKVIRGGKQRQINTEELVPGDLILLETGDFVPADARLISASNIKAEESALTGESVPVEKEHEQLIKEDASIGDRRNMVFSGSSISYGRGRALVTATGMNTEVGKIANMIMEHDSPETPLQKKLEAIGKILGLGALGICVFIFLMGILKNIDPFDMFMTSVSLAVAAIPEGLPAIVTIMLALGVQNMAKRNAIIKKLPAVETLGGATVICSDKTGTLTQNKMTVVEIRDSYGVLNGNDESKSFIIKLASLCNNSVLYNQEGEYSALGDPTETALVIAAANLRMDKNNLDAEYPRIGEIPFDSGRKLMSTVHSFSSRTGSKYIIITKGAPDVLLQKCGYYLKDGQAQILDRAKAEEIKTHNMQMADKALRVLAVAYKEENERPRLTNNKEVESNLIFAGLIGMIDPPREEAAEAVRTCIAAGIKPVMVTGDHILTAKAIAKKLGILNAGDRAISGGELSNMDQDQLEKEIYNYSVFARVSPEHKVRIVKAFQSRGAVVAMTGDGVNDAPALKAADIGCAMGISGTDTSKAAADMVLADDNFATIVEAVRHGRGIYANIKKSVHFLLSSNIGEIVSIFIAIMLGWDTPLLAIHLLWVNLVTDSLPAISLGLDPADPDIMRNKPVDPAKSLFADGLWYRISAEGIMIGLLSLLAFAFGTMMYDAPGSHAVGRTMAFATLSISELFHAFNMRSEKSIFSIDLLENKYLVGALIIGIILQFTVINVSALSAIFKVVPLQPAQWLIVFFLSVAPIIILELQKLFASKHEALRTQIEI